MKRLSRSEFPGFGAALDVKLDEIKSIQVVRTVVGGRTMHPKGEAS